MAYKKKTYKRKYYRKRNVGEKVGRYLGGKAGGWVYSKVKQLADIVNVEYKEFASTATISPSWSGDLTQFHALIPQDSTASGRSGDSVKLQRFTLRGVCYMHASATYTSVRIIIYRASGPIATGVAITDYLTNTGSAHGVIGKKVQTNRFATKTLYDRTYHMSVAGKAGQNVFINLPLNYHVEYDTASTTGKTNGLYMIVISNEQTNVPTFRVSYQLSYTDN